MRLRILFAGPELHHEHRTFSDYNIQEDATLHIVVASPDPIPIVGDGGFRLFINILPGGTKIEVKTRSDATIGEIKGMILPVMGGIPVDNMRMIAAGKVLEDGTTLDDNNICSQGCVHVQIPSE